MMNIPLESKPYKVIEVKAKTRAKMFEAVEVGDVLLFAMTIAHAGHASGGGVYPSVVHVFNVTKGQDTTKTQSELVNILRRSFELVEI